MNDSLPANAHIENVTMLKITDINTSNRGYYECEGKTITNDSRNRTAAETFYGEVVVKVISKLLVIQFF